LNLCFIARFFPPAYSGAGEQAEVLGRELIRHGDHVLVLTTSEGVENRLASDAPANMEVKRISGRHAEDYLGQLLLGLQMSRQVIRHRSRVDAILLFGISLYTYIPLLVARMLRIPAVVRMTLIDCDDLLSVSQSRWGHIKLFVIRHCAVAIVSLSAALTCRTAPFLCNTDTRLVEIPNGVDLDRFPPRNKARRRRARAALSFGESENICLFVGMLHRRKGVDLLLEAWRVVKAERPGARLVLVGPKSSEPTAGVLDSEFTGDSASALGVRFAPSGDVAQYAAASDLFVFPSRLEGFPNALLEVLAVGLPAVIMSAEWNEGCTFRHGRDLWVVKGGAANLAESILRLLDDKDLRDSLSEAGQAQVRRNYSITSVVRKYRSMFSGLVAS